MPVRNDFQPGEFCWIDLVTKDLQAASAWYGSLFGWTHQLMETPGGGPPYAFLMSGSSVVAGLGQMNDEMCSAGVPPMWNSYIATTDCAATETAVKEFGGTVTVPTMEIPGHGKLAFFLDPGGASFAAWQPLSSTPPGMLVQEPVSLCWNELMTRDTAQAAEFYGKVAGWSSQQMPMGDVHYHMLKSGDKDAGGMMAMGPEHEGVPPHWMVYLSVADCDATAAKAQETGGKVLVPPMDTPVGRFACLMDPQGAAFSVITLTNTDC